MNTIVRREGKLSIGVGWMLVGVAALTVITSLILAVAIDSMFLVFL